MSKAPMRKVVADLSEVSRRDLIKTLGPAAAVGLAGCLGGNDGTDENTPGDSTTQADDETPEDSGGPTAGGTLHAGMKVGIETMDGRSVTGLQSFQVFYNIYSKLLRYRQEGDTLLLEGDLATAWEWEDDTTLVFELNEDAVFHNGEPVTANDVAHTFATMYDKPEYTASLLFPSEVTVEAADDHTAVFHTGEKPLASLESNVGFIVGIINEKADNEGDMSTQPVGSGPFVFEEWVDGDHVYLNRFEEYWKTDEEGTQLPYLDRIEFNIYPEVDTKLTNVEQGQLDWIDLVPRRNVERVRNDDSLVTMESGPGAFMGILQMNTVAEPFSDVNVRRAVLHAIDWDAVLKVAFYDVAERGSNEPIPPTADWELDFEDPYADQDVDKAKEYLANADIEADQGFTNYVTRGDQVRVKMQEVIIAQLNEHLGINAEIQVAEGSLVFEKLSNHEFGFSISGFNGMFDPDQVYSVNLVDGAFFNYGNYVNDEIQQLLVDARQTLDHDERLQMYSRVKELYSNDAAKYYPYWDNAVYAMQPYVKNFSPLLDQEWWFEQVWMDQ